MPSPLRIPAGLTEIRLLNRGAEGEASAILRLTAGRYAIAPGEYGLICFVPDATDGKPHFMHGVRDRLHDPGWTLIRPGPTRV